MSNQVTINLIPKAVLVQRVASARVRAWAVACSAVALAVVTLWTVLASRTVGDQAMLNAELARTRLAADESERRLAEAKTTLAASARALESARAVAGHPDWSVLLAVLSRAKGDGIILEHVEVQPAAKSAASARAAAAPSARRAKQGTEPYRIALAGVAQDQSAVAAFLLALEHVDLFDSVQLRATKQRTVGERAAVGFELDCSLQPGEARGVTKQAEVGGGER